MLRGRFYVRSGTSALPVASYPSCAPVYAVKVYVRKGTGVEVSSRRCAVRPRSIFIFVPKLLISIVRADPRFAAGCFALSGAFFCSMVGAVEDFSPRFFSCVGSHFLCPLPRRRVRCFVGCCALLGDQVGLPGDFSERTVVTLLEVVFLSLCGSFRGCVGREGGADAAHGRSLAREFCALVVSGCERRGRIVFCTSGLRISSGCLSRMIGRADKGSPGS